jgi:hypothetical protein
VAMGMLEELLSYLPNYLVFAVVRLRMHSLSKEPMSVVTAEFYLSFPAPTSRPHGGPQRRREQCYPGWPETR